MKINRSNKFYSMNTFFHAGRYYILLTKIFAKPEKFSVYRKLLLREIDMLIINSIGIIVLISIFMGAAITLQTAYNFETPFIPKYYIGLGARDTLLLEFSSTIVSLILAGRVGSSIASEIGTMRVTEQIDALEIMGVNSAAFLVLPKVVATMLFNPLLSIISMFVGLIGGYLAVLLTGVISMTDYIYGIQYAFIPFYITYSLIKMVVFAFLIATISAYQGYYTSGGALEVGRSSTKAVVYSSVLILLANILLTQLLLA